MDIQSKAKKLIEMIQTAPVEWKPLGEIAEVSAGNSAPQNSAFFENGIYPFCRTSDVGRVHHSINFYQIQDKLNDIGIKGLRLFKKETILLPKSGASTLLNHRVMLTIDSYVSSHLATIYRNEKIVLAKYLFYFLSQFDVNELIPDKSYPSLKVTEIAKIKIPIPPLEIQQKIVKILDKFTELEATLEAELALRKRQYQYYRDFLLDFNNRIGGGIADNYKGRLKDVVWKTLGEVALDFGRGKSKHRPRNDVRLYGGSIPFIQTGDIKNAGHIIESYTQTYNDFGLKQSKLWKKGTLCITIAANIAETAVLGFDACFPDSVIGFVANPKETTSDYVEYLLSSLKMKLQEKGMGSAQENINLATFSNMRFPFPSLPEQEKIVAILDKFDTLTHSISEGLPHEIALRRKQYEYYREQLLAFPKAA